MRFPKARVTRDLNVVRNIRQQMRIHGHYEPHYYTILKELANKYELNYKYNEKWNKINNTEYLNNRLLSFLYYSLRHK